MDLISKRLFALPDTTINNPIILMYHGTPDSSILNEYDVSTDNFKRHLDLLKQNGWQTVTVSELDANKTFPGKTIVITFDDGYYNNYKGAYQELLKREMRATWFIVSSTIGNTSTWLYENTVQQPMLNNEQLSDMSHHGMEIGSHTSSHTKLTQLTHDEIYNELVTSRNSIADIINKEITSFAYPYGVFDTQIIDLVKKAGYKTACSTRSGKNNMTDDIFKLRRITVSADDSLSSFARKIALADNNVGIMNTSKYILSRLTKRF